MHLAPLISFFLTFFFFADLFIPMWIKLLFVCLPLLPPRFTCSLDYQEIRPKSAKDAHSENPSWRFHVRLENNDEDYISPAHIMMPRGREDVASQLISHLRSSYVSLKNFMYLLRTIKWFSLRATRHSLAAHARAYLIGIRWNYILLGHLSKSYAFLQVVPPSRSDFCCSKSRSNGDGPGPDHKDCCWNRAFIWSWSVELETGVLTVLQVLPLNKE